MLCVRLKRLVLKVLPGHSIHRLLRLHRHAKLSWHRHVTLHRHLHMLSSCWKLPLHRHSIGILPKYLRLRHRGSRNTCVSGPCSTEIGHFLSPPATKSSFFVSSWNGIAETSVVCACRCGWGGTRSCALLALFSRLLGQHLLFIVGVFQLLLWGLFSKRSEVHI